MIEFFLERQQRVFMARVTGVYGVPEMERVDDFVKEFVGRHGKMRALYDFGDVEKIAVPATRLAERARQPSMIGGLRVLVAPKSIGLGTTRTFSERQSDAGHLAPMVVARLEEAYVLLGLDHKAQFDPLAAA